jgi:hypothetical protein
MPLKLSRRILLLFKFFLIFVGKALFKEELIFLGKALPKEDLDEVLLAEAAVVYPLDGLI